MVARMGDDEYYICFVYMSSCVENPCWDCSFNFNICTRIGNYCKSVDCVGMDKTLPSKKNNKVH